MTAPQATGCPKCGGPRTLRNYCNPCRRAYEVTWREKRKAEGKPVRGRTSKARAREWKKEYEQRADVKQRRAAQMRRYARDPAKMPRFTAGRMLRREIVAGRIKRQPCVRCGEVKTDGHHPDYQKPLEVVWLCRACHSATHAQKRADQRVAGARS